MQCRWWWRAVCRHSRAVSPLLTCPAPRDCRLTLRICVACWVSDDLDAWPACARRTVVASVNVIVVTVLDRCPLCPNVLLFLNLHHTTTTPPKTATRSPDITTPPPPTNNTQRPPSSYPSPSHPLETPTSLPPLLLTSVIYCSRAHLEEQQELGSLPGTKTPLVAIEKESPWRIPALQPTRPPDRNLVTCATWTLAPPRLETV
jgi:hypothetical protein